MKTKFLVSCILALAIIFFWNSKSSKAGPFGKYGKWIDTGEFTKICSYHFYYSTCLISGIEYERLQGQDKYDAELRQSEIN